MASPLAQQAAGKPPRGPQYQAQQMLNPVIAALTKAAMGKARRSEAAIQGFTNSYANQLGQINSAEPYANAEAGQASIDAALQQSLAGHGSDLASQLAQRLSGLQGSSGAGALAQQSGALASQGQSAGDTRLASGSASLSALLANAANARSYDRKAPGFARLSGLQGIKQAEGNAQQAIDQGTLQAESQLPSLIHDQQVLKSENQYRGAQIAQGNARLQIEQQNANTSAMRAAQLALSDNRSYGLALSRLGIESRRLQLEALKQEAALQGGGLSPSEVSRYKSLSYSGANAAWDAGATYRSAMETITAKGVPVSLAAKALAQAGYKPGVRGTPFAAGQYTGNPNHPYAGVAGPIGPISLKGLGKLYRQAGGRPFVATDPASYRTGGVESKAAGLIVNMARQYQGTPYVWGGESPKGFDCSGFAQYLYSHAGISIPRTTYTQWTASNGQPVGKGQLLPGDLVFYKGADSITQNGRVLPGHVGIYLGNGKVMNAYGTGYGVRVDALYSPALGGYMGARRYK